ncbi:MAG TPA: alpha/beta hydrolase [Solirubrobacterales bacterium]|nr:alpha/beta hydrolase [Solirubrobacterales bacterium]
MTALVAFARKLWVLQRLGAPPRLTFQVLRWMVRFGAREFAFWYALIDAAIVAALVLSGAVEGTLGLLLAVVFGLLCALEIRFAWASWRSARAVAEELADLPPEPESVQFPRSHLVFPLLMLYAPRVRHRRGIVYHRDAGKRIRLDVYEPKARPSALRPAVIQVHGGGWILGSRVEQGIPLLNHLAANGWVGFNVDYRLSPRVTMPEHVIDVKRAIAWVRAHAEEYAIDPGRVCITGGSAGGHLTALAALTANDPLLQPGFEDADTSVVAAVPFYGLYDLTDPESVYSPGIRDWLIQRIVFGRPYDGNEEDYRAASPTHRVHADAPPFLVIHGEHDTLVPVEDARAFATRLEAVSRSTVRYVELPGAEHAFDVFPSLRTARIVEGIERFLRATVGPPAEQADSAATERSDAPAILSGS